MTYETAKAAAEFLIKNAEETNVTPSINFFGGEPMLMWDSIIVPLTNWIRNEYKKPFSRGITTNGTLLNEEKVQFLKNNGIGLLLSIDGDKETQDYNRPYVNGEGSFDSIKTNIPIITQNFINTTFRMTCIPPTSQYLFNNIMFAKNNNFNSFFVIPNVFEDWDENSRNIVKEEIRKYGDYYIDSMRNNISPIYFSTFELSFNDIKQINNAISTK
jgi:sulfatase maturation enzyme AslB (radical SAM superfamily)